MISNHVSMKAFPASHHEYTFKFVYERGLDSITSQRMDKSEMAYNPNLMDGGSDGGHGNLPQVQHIILKSSILTMSDTNDSMSNN